MGMKKNVFKLIRARHESLNRKLSVFGMLGARFRHSMHLHGLCFLAVANVVQISS